MSEARALPRRVLHELYTHGDRDLLFGSLLHWLLDDDAEHGLGKAMVLRLAAFLEERDCPELAFALQSDMLPVSSELLQRGETADLLVSLAESPRLALVSLATATQEPHVLAEYQALEATPIVVAHPGSQAPDSLALPVWRWALDLEGLLPQLPAGPFGDFARQLLAYDPDDPAAASSLMDFRSRLPSTQEPGGSPPAEAPGQRSVTQAPGGSAAAAAPPPRPATPPPSPAPGPGGGLSDGWSGGDDLDSGGDWGSSGGGLSDGWMGG